jgi:hypothetical protein
MPLLDAICDENNHGSSTLCLLPIENERIRLLGFKLILDGEDIV